MSTKDTSYLTWEAWEAVEEKVRLFEQDPISYRKLTKEDFERLLQETPLESIEDVPWDPSTLPDNPLVCSPEEELLQETPAFIDFIEDVPWDPESDPLDDIDFDALRHAHAAIEPITTTEPTTEPTTEAHFFGSFVQPYTGSFVQLQPYTGNFVQPYTSQPSTSTYQPNTQLPGQSPLDSKPGLRVRLKTRESINRKLFCTKCNTLQRYRGQRSRQ